MAHLDDSVVYLHGPGPQPKDVSVRPPAAPGPPELEADIHDRSRAGPNPLDPGHEAVHHAAHRGRSLHAPREVVRLDGEVDVGEFEHWDFSEGE